ncbi:histidine--tRNA ligase [Candidatus Saccharibacteria bacterium]|nr:histidine--tRNA ligase [Candidatus Saccharibacteria bacterium]
MKKLNTSPISGMQELLPKEQAVFNKFKDDVREVYRHHGFLEIETPTIDRAEILFAKAGGETEKQIYKVVKTEETEDEADQALRFDQTVPLARYIVEHESDLAFPFRVTQVGRSFRGERAQKGRFREFYQADIDVIGRNELAIEYDAEVIITLSRALDTMHLPQKLIRISNRKILAGFLEELNLQEVAKDIFSIVDHAEKVPLEKTREWLASLSIGDERVNNVLGFIAIAGKRVDVVERLNRFGFENEKFKEGIRELDRVLSILEKQGLGDSVVADMKIVRGLDYYTGTVFETILPDYKEIGSICSGGRYENLAGLYTDQQFPGVGGSIGLTRLFYILNEYNLVHRDAVKRERYAIVPFANSDTEIEMAHKVADELRENGKDADIVFSDKKLGDKIKYAGRTADYLVVIGENEVNTGKYQVKNLATGEVTDVNS